MNSFKPAREAAKSRIEDLKFEDNNISSLPSNSLGECYDFSDLNRLLVKDEELENILILSSCLEHSHKLKRRDDEEERRKIETWLSERILPDGKVFSFDESENEKSSDKELEVKKYRYKYTLLLTALSRLPPPNPICVSTPPKPTLLSLIAFTSLTAPWTTSTTHSLSTTLLLPHKEYLQSSEFIVTYLLQTFIRPLFSKTHLPTSITASSRKAAPSSAPPRHFDIRENDASNQPWRSTVPYALTILSWIIEVCPSTTLQTQAFPLLIPPLLTLLDSPSNNVRVHTLHMLPSLFRKMSAPLLKQTGLGSVFEDAILPILLFLPTITPLEDTVRLLPAAYEALYVLGDVRFGSSNNERLIMGIEKDLEKEKQRQIQLQKDRLQYLNGILRRGVLPAYLSNFESPPILSILITQIKTLIPKMGIWGVKHLKDILPILTTTLTNPFLPVTSPTLILTTLCTLRVVILTLWPRISYRDYRLDILQALSLLWGILESELRECESESGKEVKREEKKIEMEKMKAEVRETAKVFVVAVRASKDKIVNEEFERELKGVVGASGELSKVFEI